MNGTQASIKKIIESLNAATISKDTEVVVAPPALYLLNARQELRKDIGVSAQNVFDKPQGTTSSS